MLWKRKRVRNGSVLDFIIFTFLDADMKVGVAEIKN